MLASDGIGSSIAAGVRATAHWDGWLIMLADMPRYSRQRCAVAQALTLHAQARCWRGQPGHPVGFSRASYAQLTTLEGETAARELLMRQGVHLLATDDAGAVRDIDLPSMWSNGET